ncbi:hypothetical protein FO519_006015 [Halicephalobus sp. NKZ332]|nr:hypothetical protein FO519_006015 [Halicephalobus sp. NKZ332]
MARHKKTEQTGSDGHKETKKPAIKKTRKQAKSAYFFFLDEARPRLKESHKSMKAVMKAAGEEWKSLSDKSKYEKLAADDKARLQREAEDNAREQSWQFTDNWNIDYWLIDKYRNSGLEMALLA